MSTVMLLHPGNMGAAVGAGLVAAGHEVRCLLAGRSADTQARARDTGLTPADDISGCDVVLSICPPEAAAQTALAATGFTGLYIDANATSPDTARTIAHTVQAYGATYVDGGIIGPPPTRSDTTRLYVSGPSAGAAVALFDGSVLSVRVLDGGGEFGASALKMAYAGWSKVSAALLLAALDTATAHGVGDALMAEWQISRPDVPGRVPSARDSARTKGWRWSGEMREIARTFAEGGEPAAFGEGAAEIYSRYPRPAGS
jgi:3-hydroxyisobutyrate dehydrogenase-like beta-hydroxyacid dehydrogenase